MKSCIKRFFAVTVILAMLLVSLPANVFAAGDAMETAELQELLNNTTLYPQETGYLELDALLAQILGPYKDCDTYTRIKAAYDWCVREIDYSWAAYSQNWAPAYDCFVPQYDLTYEAGLQEAIPYEVANRSYHALKYHNGVCYEYAAVFAVMARYIGINAFVHTGNFTFEPYYGTGYAHHGWGELCIDGEYYIFDPQRDYRMSGNGTGTIPYNYFGIPYKDAWRYAQETELNAARDALFLPVEAERARQVNVYATATASGTAHGGGRYYIGETATVWVDEAENFLGWYLDDGTLLTEDTSYTFEVEGATTLWAIYEGEMFFDVHSYDWYHDDVIEAEQLGIVNGTAPFTFNGNGSLTRAMAVTMLFRAVEGTAAEGSSPFADVPNGCWYTDSVIWAYEAGIVTGITETEFAPDVNVTREQAITMLMRYYTWLGLEAEAAELPYEDAADISDYARTYLEQAQSLELINGYADNTLMPQALLTRAEGVTLIMRLLQLLDSQ